MFLTVPGGRPAFVGRPPDVTVRQVKELPVHVTELWNKSCKHLDNDQPHKLSKVLTQYAYVFSIHDTDLGRFSAVKHSINTRDTNLIRQKMWRIPLGFENEEKVHPNSLLTASMIRPLSSAWASPPVLVRKKDGRVRFCIDYRALNETTVKDAFPLPNIEECSDTLEGTEFFSTSDMSSDYYQIEVSNENTHKTTSTRYGLFEYK